MNRNLLIVVVVVIVLLLGLGFYANYQAKKTKMQQNQTALQEQQAMEMKQQQEKNQAKLTQAVAINTKIITIPLATVNTSGQSGTAKVTEENGKVKVVLDTTGFTPNVSQPAHIHVGSCPGIGKVLYPLTNIVNGHSETSLDVSMNQLLAQLPLAINVHKSVQSISVYSACGNIPGTTNIVSPSENAISPRMTVTNPASPTTSSGY